METPQIRPYQIDTYLMRLQGALNSSSIDWCGDETITTKEHTDTPLVSLTINSGSLRDFLDQFKDLKLTVLPEELCENTDRTK